MTPLETAFANATGFAPAALSLPIKTALSATVVAAMLGVIIASYHTLMHQSEPCATQFLWVVTRALLLLCLWLVLIW